MRSRALGRLGVAQVQDLLFVLPLRYEDRTTVVGRVAAPRNAMRWWKARYSSRRSSTPSATDAVPPIGRHGISDAAILSFFRLAEAGACPGNEDPLFRRDTPRPARLEIVHPEYRRVTVKKPLPEETLTPIYPLTEGVPQGRLRALIAQALRELEAAAVRDWIPRGAGVPRAAVAARCPGVLHRPPREAQLGELAAAVTRLSVAWRSRSCSRIS